MQNLHAAGHKHNHSKDKGNKRKASRVQRACLNCRKRKQGCEEERPCRRCLEKGIDCVESDLKRKRGRVKAYVQRSRAGNDDLPEYNWDEEDDENEDFFDSDGEDLSSEEDQSSMISPRGSSSNSASHCCSGSQEKSLLSTPGHVIPHTFNLSGSNTSTGSSIHTQYSASNDSVENPRSPTSPDSPNYGDVNDVEPDDFLPVEMEEAMEDVIYKPNLGLHLGLLLPFIANLGNSSEEQNPVPMSLDEEFEAERRSDSSNYSTGYHFNTCNQVNSFNAGESEYQKSRLPTGPEGLALHQKLCTLNIPFYTSSLSSTQFPSYAIEEGDSRAQVYIKECLEELQYKSRVRNYDSDLQRVNETWKEILRCLRNLDWQKAQGLLQELESLQLTDSFGENLQPGLVCWSSGGRIHHANESFCKLVGYSPEELKVEVSVDVPHSREMRVHSIFHPEEMMKILKRQLEAAQNPEKSSYQINTRLLSKQRQEIPISCSVLNLRDNMGLSLLTVAIFV